MKVRKFQLEVARDLGFLSRRAGFFDELNTLKRKAERHQKIRVELDLSFYQPGIPTVRGLG